MRQLTAKQDAFTRHVATGMTQCDAYRVAYNASNMLQDSVYVEASRLCADPKIALRINQLRDAQWKAERFTREMLVQEAMEGSRRAMEAGQSMAAFKGLEIAGKMLGAI